ncbi:lactate utilization protein B [Mangrovibacterium diazotrophicum]|uniref:L-lactate dehydrogenase complex protein LldF n=1 Tax=Mangrovibacterium diazotrophicum TaxID=1261403 RepID=A0A419W9X4_9BACT|nr:lactate utilization protein B [Mangrovibacterium diazotrophicum]RKD92281.1 L-lactate dehydrogenase complex protein LldF [Mangrovibacterium diazotrophicum]
MTEVKEKFLHDADKIAFDKKHRATIKFNISRYDLAVDKGMKRYSNLELAKERGSFVKQTAVENLDQYLVQFEKNISARGAEVIWAEDSAEAIQSVVKILKENGAKLIVKSKSMTTEEVDLNEHVEEIGVHSLETDLGEYIVQLAGEKPYHIVTPCMHKSKEDIAELFHEKFDTPEKSTPEYLTAFVRSKLRENFTKADVGVTGANFLIADIGGIALTENEGNAMMTFSFPKVHIVIAGIEKLVPKMNDLGLMWPLLAAHGTGQQITVYNSIVSGPKREGEKDGPEKMYVILLDNKRSELYQQKEQYLALKCIRCGACLNACPIYKNIGGYTYAATYSGPIGSVITPFFKGFSDYNHLSSACSVCGKCTEVCPVKIPLHNLLLFNRRDAVEQGNGAFMWNQGMKAYQFAFAKRSRLDAVGGKLKNTLAGFGKNALGEQKQVPHFADKSFSQQWKSTHKDNN